MKRINHQQHDNTLETDIFLLVKTEKNIYKALIKIGHRKICHKQNNEKLQHNVKR